MRRFTPQVPRQTLVRLAIATVVAAGLAISIQAQVPGRNVNMVSGITWPTGRSVPAAAERTLDRGLDAKSTSSARRLERLPNGRRARPRPMTTKRPATPGSGSSSRSTAASGGPARCCPVIRRITSPAALASPLKGYQAGADPVVRAGTQRSSLLQRHSRSTAVTTARAPSFSRASSTTTTRRAATRSSISVPPSRPRPPARSFTTSPGWRSTSRATTRRRAPSAAAAAIRPRTPTRQRAESTTADRSRGQTCSAFRRAPCMWPTAPSPVKAPA